MSYTPGPWHAPHDDSPYWKGQNAVPVAGPNGVMVARASDAGKRGHERNANARLIAAAPELLEACQAMLEAYAPNADFADRTRLHSAVLAAHDAIAKAIG